jgi:hypothetical protein
MREKDLESYKVRLTITADSDIETRLLEHLAGKRRASMANECRDLLQAGLGRPLPPTPLSETASRARKALKFDLTEENDADVLAALSSVAAPDRHRWLRQRMLAGFARLPLIVDIALEEIVLATKPIESEDASRSKDSTPSNSATPASVALAGGTDNEVSSDQSRPEGLNNQAEPILHEDGYRLRPELRSLLG